VIIVEGGKGGVHNVIVKIVLLVFWATLVAAQARASFPSSVSTSPPLKSLRNSPTSLSTTPRGWRAFKAALGTRVEMKEKVYNVTNVQEGYDEMFRAKFVSHFQTYLFLFQLVYYCNSDMQFVFKGRL
jgi:hypothetical protein